MTKDNYVIGVLGGMGTYATIHLFQQYALFAYMKDRQNIACRVGDNSKI